MPSLLHYYCNTLYLGISQGSLSRFQMVQNAAACLLTGVKKYEHITPIMSLHWLPVRTEFTFTFSRRFYPKRRTNEEKNRSNQTIERATVYKCHDKSQ